MISSDGRPDVWRRGNGWLRGDAMILHSSRSSFGAVMVLATTLAALSACTSDAGVALESFSAATTSAVSTQVTETTTASTLNSETGTSSSGLVESESFTSGSVATTSAVDQEAEDRAQIEEVWRSFWDLYQEINRIPESDRAAMVDELAIDPIRTDVINKAAEFNVEGLDNYGSVVSHPYWSTPVAGQNMAQLGDCQDASQFGSLFVESGKKRTVGVVNNNMLGGFTRVGDGWKLHQIVYLRDVDCVP